jgi:taurine dioxygenase
VEEMGWEMEKRTRRLSEAGGVEVEGFDLRTELDAGSFEELEGLFDTESLILLRNQSISHDDGRELFARFGPLIDGIGVVSNEEATGRGELKFHSEQSFQRANPIRGLALYCRAIGPNGGATLFVDCAAAYRALPAELKSELSHTDTVHSFDPRVRLGSDYGGTGIPEGGWQTVHPAILEHPVTGIPILFVSPWFTTGIVGRSTEEADALLSVLVDHLANPAFSYRHEWQPNDLLMWDNLSMTHAREPYDESASRVLWKYEFKLREQFHLPEPNLALQ